MNTYFDNNATTPLDPPVLDAMLPFLREHFANPSSGSTDARKVHRAVEKARGQVAALVGCQPGEIIFTSGGTESNNSAIFSATEIFPTRRHLISAPTEHDCVRQYLRWLQETRGYEITWLKVDSQGRIDLAELATAIRPDETALVTLMWANNETGVLHPVAEAAQIAADHDVLFHTDAVQVVGKIPLQLASTSIHSLALSGHKFHAPKGIGALYVDHRVPFRPWLLGGGQENQRRSGTENVSGIIGLGAAAEAAAPTATSEVRDYFESEIQRHFPDVSIHAVEAPRIPNTSNLRLPGTHAEGLMILLDRQGIALSAGSACHTGALHPSHVLEAMGLNAVDARECLRISFSRHHTRADASQLVEALATAIGKMRRTLLGS